MVILVLQLFTSLASFTGSYTEDDSFFPHLSKLNCKLGPIRTSGQVLNVITFLTKTKLSRQVRDILKKTKGVSIITIALRVLLASWYISRHGRLVQISNNQAGPRGERF